MVTGIRQDAFAIAYRMPVEHDKPASEKGTYLYPTEMGFSKSLSFSEKLDRRPSERQHPWSFWSAWGYFMAPWLSLIVDDSFCPLTLHCEGDCRE